jgi:hypothetical protein
LVGGGGAECVYFSLSAIKILKFTVAYGICWHSVAILLAFVATTHFPFEFTHFILKK